MPDLYGEKLADSKAYLATHHITEILQSLTQSLLIERPDNPRPFMEKHLHLLRSTKVGQHLTELT